MCTILLRCASQIQSWGTGSRNQYCRTAREPTKSGITGLIASALGRDRTEDISDIASLKMGVRVDREGKLHPDYQLAHPLKNRLKPYSRENSEDAHISTRYYLDDAVFLVGIESDRETVEQIDFAINHPVYSLYLGRRNCIPYTPFNLGIREEPLIQALQNEPLLYLPTPREYAYNKVPEQIRLIYDADPNDKQSFPVWDYPLSFGPVRQYTYRPVREEFIPNPACEHITEHDPMDYLQQLKIK